MSSCFLASDNLETYKILRQTDGDRYRLWYVSYHVLFSNPDISLDSVGRSTSTPVLSRCIKHFHVENRLLFKRQTTYFNGRPFGATEKDVRIYCFCCKEKIDYIDMINNPVDIPLYRSPQDVVYNKTYSVGPVFKEIPAVPDVSPGFRIYDNNIRTISSNTNLILSPGEEFCFYIVTVIDFVRASGGTEVTIDADNGAFIDYEIRFN